MRASSRSHLVERRLVAFLLGQLGEPDRVGQTLLEPALALDRRRQPVALAHDGLRPLRIVPELRVLGERGQLVQAGQGLIPVKDASVAAGGHR